MYHYNAKKSRRVNKRVIILIISLFVLAGIGYVLFFSPVFKIKEIIVSGNKKTSSEEIKNSLVYDNMLLATSRNVKGELTKKFPEILDLKVSKNLFKGKLEINIQEREIVGILCNQETSGCFYFDKDGIVFENAPSTSGSLVTLIKDYSKRDFGPGDAVLDKNFVDTILLIKEDLFQKIGLKVASFDIESYPIEKLRVVTSESWYILFSLQRDIKSQLLALKVALDEKIKDRMGLEYVDLRIENRIYYK
jgi:hypothetical protein